MQYAITFLEGIVTFISPCLLPMLPVFLTYFAGGESGGAAGGSAGGAGKGETKRTLNRALGFILGFTAVFVSLGAFAGLLGGLLTRNLVVVNIVAGAIVVLFGLNYIGVLKIKFLNMNRSGGSGANKISGFFSAVLFGIVFSISWTPCVGMFLGSALLLASQQGSAAQGILMLLCFSLGLGIPFLFSAVLIDKLKSAFNWIKKNYKAVNMVSGLFLVAIGILTMTGLMNRFLSLLTF